MSLRRFLLAACLIALGAACFVQASSAQAPPAPEPPTDYEGLQVRLQLAHETDGLTLNLRAPAEVVAGGMETALPAGRWRVSLSSVYPPRVRYHVFAKAFKPREEMEMRALVSELAAAGYDAEVVPFGKRFQLSDGRIIDNRYFWVSAARADTEAAAQALVPALQQRKLWAWVRREVLDAGAAAATFTPVGGGATVKMPTPLLLMSPATILLEEVDSGFWGARRGNLEAPGRLVLSATPESGLEVLGELGLDDYLRGVLPAEMPSSWPAQALQAQAVAARSEVLSTLAGKHRLEGFDFCGREHCRAYRGLTGHEPTTDAAIAATLGEALVHDGAVAPTVFSANCGGWTEDNENVWSGPPNIILRGTPDYPAPLAPATRPDGAALGRWLRETPPAWCGEAGESFRWRKRMTAAELSRLVAKVANVGTVTAIEPLERGVSGRLMAVQVRGTAGSEIIRKELAIRRAFGGLHSALFVVSREGSGPSAVFTFTGGGRGHGVGMCQHGARGMAAAGKNHRDILLHYFNNVTLERLD